MQLQGMGGFSKGRQALIMVALSKTARNCRRVKYGSATFWSEGTRERMGIFFSASFLSFRA